VQVPVAQVTGPVQLKIISSLSSSIIGKTHVCPPHCPYNAAPVPLEAVEVAALLEEVMEEDFTVDRVVDEAFVVEEADFVVVDEAPPAPQTNGVGPGIS
jgi:hypothetical protein